MTSLFRALTEFGNVRREGETTVHWVAYRDTPIAPYETLISNYGSGCMGTEAQQKAINQLLTLDELRELGDYLSYTRGWNLKYQEVHLPKDMHVPLPLIPKEGIIKLFEEPDNDLSAFIVGISSIRLLPGASMEEIDSQAGQRNKVWGMFFFEELFNRLGIELSDKDIFSNENLLKIYDEVFYESGLYVQKFGEKDLFAEITPEDHVVRLDKNEEIKMQIKAWRQQQESHIDDNISTN